jgi:hypothetical protein
MTEAAKTLRSWRLSKPTSDTAMPVEFLVERLAELELALEDNGWNRLGQDLETEFSYHARKTINKISRYMWLKNPLIKRAVTLKTDYTWGQGFEISIDDETLNSEIQKFFDDPGNSRALFSEQARRKQDIELQITGNRFYVMHGVRAMAPSIRSIPTDQIVDIICSPEDVSEPWFYKRVRVDQSGKEIVEYHPDWLLERKLVFGLSGEILQNVLWDKPVYHVSVNNLSDMKFGVSEVYAAIDWSRAYKEFLEDWATITRSFARFAWKATAKGSRGIASVKDKLNSSDTNPPPVAGSVFIETEGVNFQPLRTSGATASAEDGRRLLLMVAAATDLPEIFFGDANVGNHATSKTLDRPTELAIKGRQELWSGVYSDIVKWYFMWMNRPLSNDITIDIDWPPVLQHNIKEGMDAVVQAANLPRVLDTKTTQRLVLTMLGVDDIDEVINSMDFSEEDERNIALPIEQQIQQTLERIKESVNGSS